MDIMSIIIAIVFILDIFNGYRKGLVKVLIDVLGVVIAIFMAFTFYRPVGFFISRFFPNMALVLQNVVGFVVVFVLISVLLQIVGYILSLIMRLPGLSILNRVAGAAFSFLKTLVVLGLLFTIVFSMGILDVNKVILDSSLGTKLLNTGRSVYSAIEGILPKADDLLPKDWYIDFFMENIPLENYNAL